MSETNEQKNNEWLKVIIEFAKTIFMMIDWKAELYKLYKNQIGPKFREWAESDGVEDWDDTLVNVIDYLVERLFAPTKARNIAPPQLDK